MGNVEWGMRNAHSSAPPLVVPLSSVPYSPWDRSLTDAIQVPDRADEQLAAAYSGRREAVFFQVVDTDGFVHRARSDDGGGAPVGREIDQVAGRDERRAVSRADSLF